MSYHPLHTTTKNTSSERFYGVLLNFFIWCKSISDRSIHSSQEPLTFWHLAFVLCFETFRSYCTATTPIIRGAFLPSISFSWWVHWLLVPANRITPMSKPALRFSGQSIHFPGQQESVVVIFVRGTIRCP